MEEEGGGAVVRAPNFVLPSLLDDKTGSVSLEDLRANLVNEGAVVVLVFLRHLA